MGAGPVLETLGVEGVIRAVPDCPLLGISRSPDLPLQAVSRGDLLPPALRLHVGVAGVEQPGRVAGLVKTPDHRAESLLVSCHSDLPSDLPTELDGFLESNPSVEGCEEAALLPGVAGQADVDGGDPQEFDHEVGLLPGHRPALCRPPALSPVLQLGLTELPGPDVHVSHSSVHRLPAPVAAVVHQHQILPSSQLAVEPGVVGDLHRGLSVDDDFEPTEGGAGQHTGRVPLLRLPGGEVLVATEVGEPRVAKHFPLLPAFTWCG